MSQKSDLLDKVKILRELMVSYYSAGFALKYAHADNKMEEAVKHTRKQLEDAAQAVYQLLELLESTDEYKRRKP